MVADLAVVIVTHNSAGWMVPCLTTAYAHAGTVELEIVVADSDSTDGTIDVVAQAFPQVRTLQLDNRGFSYGNNRGVLTTDARYVLFLNADTEIQSGTFAELVAYLDARPEVGLIGVRQLTPDGTVYPTIRRFPTVSRMFFEALGSERFPFRSRFLGERELDPSAYDRETECDWTSGSFMLVRREALLGAGLMDERFFMYCEEPDLCLRIKQSGWSIRHVPSMTIVHHAGKAGWNAQFTAQDAFARRQYMAKHFSPLRRLAGLAAFSLGHALRAVYGARDPELRRARRRASLAAIRTVIGFEGAPFREPPPASVAGR
jgi:N-acetylglucosaminyl-diphospho-decaprenol L-rhamnosyltransferase